MADSTNTRDNKFFKDPDKAAVSLLILIAVIMISLLIINLISDDSDSLQYPALGFLVSGELVKDIDLKGFEENIEIRHIEFFDPMYEKEKSYSAFALGDVLRFGFGDEWTNADYTDVAFEALDGYTAVSPLSKLKEPGGYIVFQDMDSEDWEPIGFKKVNPGPYYLVWTGKDQTTKNGYPWPWQLSSVNLIKFDDQYSKALPRGAPEDSSAYKGYEIFKSRCIRCHSMNGEGGKIGPDLNAPQSIVSYRPEYMIRELIQHPSKYRYTQMPDHPDLSEQDLNDLISYFNYMEGIRN